jgi:leucyl aminopeptidase
VISCSEKFEGFEEVLIVPFWKSGLAAGVKRLAPFAPWECGDFKGKSGEIAMEYRGTKRLLLVGLGDEDHATTLTIREAYGAAFAYLIGKKIVDVDALLPKGTGIKNEEIMRSAVEAGLITNYAFDHYLKKKKKTFKALRFYSPWKGAPAYCKRAEKLFGGVSLCCDLVNGNADEVNPDKLCTVARGLAKKHQKLRTTIYRSKEIKKRGMGLIEAVGRASEVEPALIVMDYSGGEGAPTVIMGKGVTYDTGGLSLKPSSGMIDMRCDMGGSGAVFGAMEAIAALKLKVNVVGVVPTAENAIDSKSYKVGDVFPSLSGKTVEVRNTDAEGRLILADALTYACREIEPARIIDLATLTGAMEVALGSVRSGVFSNDKTLSDALFEAGECSGELLWPMPLDEEYGEGLKSPIADICHISNDRKAGSVTAAKFLEEFVENDVPWAHVDIAGTAFLGKPKGKFRSQATGFGVRFLVELIERNYAKG